MAYGSAAYDFDLFASRNGNTAPAQAPGRAPRELRQPKVLEFPREQEEQRKQPKVKRHPIRAAFYVGCFSVVLFLAVCMVYSQQQLAELTDQINTATQTLEQSRSVEVQLNMVAARKMTVAEIEAYAASVLGMSKITNSQVTYVNVAGEDKGTVVQDVDSGSGLDRFLYRLSVWFS